MRFIKHTQRKKLHRRRRGRQNSPAARYPVEGEARGLDIECGSKDDIYQHPMIVGPMNDEPLPPMNNLPGSEEYNNQEKWMSLPSIVVRIKAPPEKAFLTT
ncbi:hypothetical protein PIB30_024538 [Stylosanthes scabra]|uniref:Uncharacterized protein n=1 Tax=Stylosanthes scabra TaxID=79078 RepID=A0ABU6RA18_9FABA|nr:hypothetical protein [Stylosanthes scabra]